MKEYIITLDSGTTNTRCILWDGSRRIAAKSGASVGVRNTAIDGHNQKLRDAVKGCMEEVLDAAGITFDDVRAVIAAGMITSNVGLVEIPHLIAPVGIDDLAAGIVEKDLPEICPLPISFIPGVKNDVSPVDEDNFEAMDIMRGEEVESAAIIEHFGTGKRMILALPGSHMKYVLIDEQGKIASCLTSISGEMLNSIFKDTIIADAVDRRFLEADEYDREWAIRGYDTAKRCGLARACFSARILSQFVTKDHAKLASYVTGAVLQGDVQAILGSSALGGSAETQMIISGRPPLQQILMDLLQYDGGFAGCEIYTPPEDMPINALGACIVADRREK